MLVEIHLTNKLEHTHTIKCSLSFISFWFFDSLASKVGRTFTKLDNCKDSILLVSFSFRICASKVSILCCISERQTCNLPSSCAFASSVSTYTQDYDSLNMYRIHAWFVKILTLNMHTNAQTIWIVNCQINSWKTLVTCST